MNKKTLEEVHALYLRELKSRESFVAIGSEEDERAIKRINERAAGIRKRKAEDEANITKEEIPDESAKKKSKKKVK